MSTPFKTQQEIWKHLADGGKATDGKRIVYFKDGALWDESKNDFCFSVMSDAAMWLPYHEPLKLEFEAVTNVNENSYSRFDYKILLPLQVSDDILGKRFKVTMTEIIGGEG